MFPWNDDGINKVLLVHVCQHIVEKVVCCSRCSSAFIHYRIHRIVIIMDNSPNERSKTATSEKKSKRKRATATSPSGFGTDISRPRPRTSLGVLNDLTYTVPVTPANTRTHSTGSAVPSDEDQLEVEQIAKELTEEFWNDAWNACSERFYSKQLSSKVIKDLRNTWLRLVDTQWMDNQQIDYDHFHCEADEPALPMAYDAWSIGALELLPHSERRGSILDPFIRVSVDHTIQLESKESYTSTSPVPTPAVSTQIISSEVMPTMHPKKGAETDDEEPPSWLNTESPENRSELSSRESAEPLWLDSVLALTKNMMKSDLKELDDLKDMGRNREGKLLGDSSLNIMKQDLLNATNSELEFIHQKIQELRDEPHQMALKAKANKMNVAKISSKDKD